MLDQDREKAAQLRRDIFLTAYSYPDGPSHMASSFSIVEILYTLYGKGVLRYRPDEPQWPGRDRFILSKGHAGLALYCTLAMAGFFPRQELFTYCRPGTRLGGEPRLGELPGVEASTGSLGHGLSFGVGAALAMKLDGTENGVYVVIGDGESQEGTIWEAAMSAARHGLDNLTVILDHNRLQKMDTVASIIGIEDWSAKWRAFGWQVQQVNGHDIAALEEALRAERLPGVPRMVIASTVKGKGVSIIENNVGWHYKMPLKREMKTVLDELGIAEAELVTCREPI